ncbi:MAG: hypothetical protein ABI988_20950, partial [Nitrospirota bacterium]
RIRSLSIRGASINRAVLIDGNVIDRPVPTTNSTYVAYSAGINVNLNHHESCELAAMPPSGPIFKPDGVEAMWAQI